MGYVEGKCPECGAKIWEKCNAWVYGSPIRTCPKCRKEFLDSRWREVAIDGFVRQSTNAKGYFLAMLGFLAVTAVCVLWLRKMIVTQGYYPTKLVGCIVLGIAGTIGCAVMFVRIVTGYEDRQNARYMAESKKRLQDSGYVEKLRSFGYMVPDEYIK
ncbi:MAG: hypothetical protein NC086_10120 [Alistipes sp.]|nr:hypothetical protein [Alistipes sp.]